MIIADQPWETRCRAYINMYGSVLKEGDKIRIWYDLVTAKHRPGVASAESEDGIHFMRPVLNLHELDRSTDNNIVIPAPSRVARCGAIPKHRPTSGIAHRR